MRKTDKKQDNILRETLTQACHWALDNVDNFQWLTHKVKYTNFPASLVIVCVFDTQTHLNQFIQSSAKQALINQIQSKLSENGIELKNIAKHIQFDSEAACESNHGGN
ncbi:Fis family transcriptional regulator [Shewanella maritima]|uniref:Fis family transcriptional regulator n=1 Tax=Shewanella maritima TaxID=2520507 RepID=UPI003736EB82